MNVVILATRISGNDGVSLEAVRWGEVLRRMGHEITFVAGTLDKKGVLIPELHFQNPKITELHDRVVYNHGTYKKIESDIFKMAGVIEGELRDMFNANVKVDLLITPNTLSLPMHFPLAVALTRVIEERKVPTIVRHHDFWWERERFNKSTMFEFFKRWFPPDLTTIAHVVINSIAQVELKKRTDIRSDVIWDSFDYRSKLNQKDSFSKNFREDFRIGKDDIIFLQATRIVPRKRIELAVELIERLNNPKAVFVIAGHTGDEAGDYEDKIRDLIKRKNIRARFIGKQVNSKRRLVKLGNGGKLKRKRIYTLWDCFANADFVTYPTEVEGFGNQFVEAVYFKKPIILTPYPVYKTDIKPFGFKTIEMPNMATKGVLSQVNELIDNPKKIEEITNHNFELGKKHFSYEYVERKLERILENMGLD